METTDDLLRDSNKIKWIYVRDKETKKMIALERMQDFDPKFHEKIAELTPEPTPETPELAGEARWNELLAKGWFNLDGAEREEYKLLKPIFKA